MNDLMDSRLRGNDTTTINKDSKQFDVICIGSALLDIYLKSDAFAHMPTAQENQGTALCVELGSKVEIGEAEVCSGGGASNNAVSFARKGYKTALIAEMGKDLVATTIIEELKREKVDCSLLVQEDDEETGMSAVLVNQDGGRSVLVYRGAAKMLTKSDIPWDRVQAKWLYMSSLGGEVELMEGLIGHALHSGIRVAINPGKPDLEKILSWGGLEFFNGVDLLLLNREEMGLLLQQDLSSEQAWESLVITGPKATIVTDGRAGGKYWLDGVGTNYPAATGEAIEETGAGDAFGSGVVAGLMSGKTIPEAIDWGRIQAENVVRYMGAKKGLLNLEEISR